MSNNLKTIEIYNMVQLMKQSTYHKNNILNGYTVRCHTTNNNNNQIFQIIQILMFTILKHCLMLIFKV